MHLMVPPGQAMRDGAFHGVKLCNVAWKRGQDSHVGMFSLCGDALLTVYQNWYLFIYLVCYLSKQQT